jgi:acetoin utilization deacetylase AcuC-like enzyme
MDVVYSEAHLKHAPRRFISRGEWADNPEVPLRAINLVAAARAAGHRIIAPDDFGAGARRAVHSAAHLAFLESAHRRWSELDGVCGAGADVLPNTHPVRPGARYPEGVVGQAGWHVADTACPIGAGSWEAACASANVAVHAAQLVLDGAPIAYGLCRPPGHHAYGDLSGGFCLLNNVAIAAEHMRTQLARVAILDIDVHHGNGTQGIFYDRADVLFVSVHADPSDFYPFFAGYEDERGEGAGEDANLNLPVDLGEGDHAYGAAIERGVAAIRAFRPEALLVSLGFDAYVGDPLSPLTVTSGGFEAAGKAIAALATPTVLIQEGGYDCKNLGQNLTAFLTGFLG